MRKLFRKIALDTSPLRELPQFRYLWTSASITRFGAILTYVAMPFQIKELTHSFLAVGILGLVEIAPLIIFGLYGGALADSVDRRTMAMWTELAFMLCVGALALNSIASSPQVWILYVVAIVRACIDGLQRPSLEALVPRLVPRDKLAAASALTSLTHNVAFVFGTALGGLIVVAVGPAIAYSVDIATFAISLLLLSRISPVPPNEKASKPSLRGIAEGAQYAWTRKDLLGTYLIDTAAMVFAFPNALFPFLADSFDSPSALGLLYTAGAVGSLLATATSGWTRQINRHGLAVILAASAWGAGIALVGFAHSLTVALIGLAIAGAADMISGLFRSLIWNSTIPDELRGRLAGIELLSYSIGPELGQVRAGISAQYFGIRRAFISGGILCMISVVALSSYLPSLRKFHAKDFHHTR